MKSTNLTQINLRIDPIYRWIQGFSFRKFEDEYWCSRLDFSLVFRSKLKLMLYNGTEMSCEQAGRNGTRFNSLNSDNSRKVREPPKPSRRTELKENGTDLDRWMSCWSRSTAPIARRLTNRRLFAMTVRSSIDAHDLISSRKEEGFDRWSSVGFWSNDRDLTVSLLIPTDLSRYNSRD